MPRRGRERGFDRDETKVAPRLPASRQLLEFPGELDRMSGRRRGTAARRVEERVLRQTPRERFLRAIEMERRGFVDGALVNLRGLYREVEVAADPCLAISIRYFLASYLTLKGRRSEARALARDGIILAWEHEAREEMELFDHLARQLADEPADDLPR